MITLPITVDMTLDTSKVVFALALDSTPEQYVLDNETVINATIIDVPEYDGSYVIDPLANNAVILDTKDKLCRDNITVNKIQTARTSNQYGTTFYIAEV